MIEKDLLILGLVCAVYLLNRKINNLERWINDETTHMIAYFGGSIQEYCAFRAKRLNSASRGSSCTETRNGHEYDGELPL